MGEAEVARIVEETASALAAEGLLMSGEERANLLLAVRGEILYSDLVAHYADAARRASIPHV